MRGDGRSPAAPAPQVSFEVTDHRVVVGRNERRSAGLEHWVDGTLGVDRHGGRTLVVAPNGPYLSRHDLGAGGFISGLLEARQRIQGLPPEVDHASGGPLYRDPASGVLVLVYHGETFRDADPTDYWSFIGLAASHDDGETFRDLGRVVSSWLDEQDPGRPRPVDVGSGGHSVHDGWFHLHFQDRGILHSRRDLSVARARTDDVVAAALEGTVPTFTKYFDGRWCEPGLGGRSDELLPGLTRRVLWSDAAYSDLLGCRVVVISQVEAVRGTVAHWQQSVSLSSDGVHWSEPRPIGSAEPAEVLYVTIDSGGADQHRIEGDEFHLYRVRSTARWRWDDARLERATVRIIGDHDERSEPSSPGR